MNVVSYARVSTLRQESEQQSLVNQERAFQAWLDRGGHRRVRAYREAASAKSTEGRAEFQRMIADLAELQPDAIIVDTLDRFTRDATDGLVLLRELRGHRVGLLPLDWRRERPIDVDDDRDWQDVYDEFGAAERERRRIRRRVVRSYEGRRERGATTHNHVPFGVRKAGDALVPSDEAWIVREFDRLLLSGVGLHEAGRAIRALHPGVWAADASLKRVMTNPAYVAAGVRTTEHAAALATIAAALSARFGEQVKRVYDHEFTGVFRCHACGYRMHSIVRVNPLREILICSRNAEHENGKAISFKVDTDLRRQWADVVRGLEDDVDAWAATATAASETRRALERQIAALDQRAADLKRRRDRAFDLLVDGDASIEAQARTLLREINGDEQGIELQRSIVSAELLTVAEPAQRDAREMRSMLRAFRHVYADEPTRSRNALNRALCDAMESNPTIVRGEKRNDRQIAWAVARVTRLI